MKGGKDSLKQVKEKKEVQRVLVNKPYKDAKRERNDQPGEMREKGRVPR